MSKLNRDGVELFLEETGSGNPPLLFVHGWTCDHTYFAPQVEYFRRTHRVVAVDLRGHGQSHKPQQDYSMAMFADDLAWCCGHLGLEKPVVVGHSMGGVIALELSRCFPNLLGAIVTLDSPIVPLPAMHEVIPPWLQAFRGPDYREAQRQFLDNFLFLPTDDPTRKARIIAAMSCAPQHVMASAFEGLYQCDTAAAAAACKVPWLLLSAAQPFTDLAQLRGLCPHVVIGQTVGAGHFHQLEVPGQVNAMIERFLAVASLGGTTA